VRTFSMPTSTGSAAQLIDTGGEGPVATVLLPLALAHLARPVAGDQGDELGIITSPLPQLTEGVPRAGYCSDRRPKRETWYHLREYLV
jgi:hypothetical protein